MPAYGRPLSADRRTATDCTRLTHGLCLIAIIREIKDCSETDERASASKTRDTHSASNQCPRIRVVLGTKADRMTRSALEGNNHHEVDAGVSGDPFDQRLATTIRRPC